MEDAHATILDLKTGNDDDGKLTAIDQRLSYFGVYDGHGGDKVAIYTGENLHKIIAKQEAWKAGNFEQALKDGFLATDRAILSGMECPISRVRRPLTNSPDPKYEEEVSGCTSCVTVISKDKIFCVRVSCERCT